VEERVGGRERETWKRMAKAGGGRALVGKKVEE